MAKVKIKILEIGLRIYRKVTGFTLIELLTVLIIISVLLSGVIFVTPHISNKSQLSTAAPIEQLEYFINQEVFKLQFSNSLEKKIPMNVFLKNLINYSSKFQGCLSKSNFVKFNRYGYWEPLNLTCPNLDLNITSHGFIERNEK